MYTPVCIDETWGSQRVAGKLTPRPNFADAKAAIVSAVDMQVKACIIRKQDYEVYTLRPAGCKKHGFAYAVVVQWLPEGPDGVIASFVFAVKAEG